MAKNRKATLLILLGVFTVVIVLMAALTGGMSLVKQGFQKWLMGAILGIIPVAFVLLRKGGKKATGVMRKASVRSR